MNTLLLDSNDVDEYATLPAVIDAVEDAFAAFERGTTQMPAKSYIDLPQYNGDFRSMPAYLDAGDWDAAGLKWVNVHPNNPTDHDLPTVIGTMIYSDPETAFPLAIMDGTSLTMKRTGAAAAVATDYLAREDATSLGIVGAGVQSYTQLRAISEVRQIETVIVSDQDDERATRLVETFDAEFDIRTGSITEAGHCDVLSTVTPVDDPIISREDVGEQTHINAIGADAEGKHELADSLLEAARIVIDDHEQCTHSGEINVPYSEGVITDTDIHGEIGELVVGSIEGRTEATGVTVFDSTGLAIQDVAAAHVVYENARGTGSGYEFGLLNSA
ncbi:ornithine cyclodeaminase family protein [Natronolimnobius sp. AArcel1]|uniref:ornithine cyclodeaminase family protein n=1 Tax=Natronolimnobius sp. AArcel1 TaxID=1679093 RepID=UPI0013ED17A1|nr:ornithine cyclodeaminase family protein [Natronolimnobius sp. AArcel1]NGM68563.1 ornithine cyclodeaminase family protein [Natronolimnobius sp. AArcel1]